VIEKETKFRIVLKLISEWGIIVKPLQISPETALKLAEKLNLPLEQIMHMPQHILIQKMMELEKEENK
jgi:hypothetical protein